MKDLLIEELELIAGGYGVPGAVVNAAIAGAGYIGYQSMTGEGSMNGFATTVAAGAISGFIAGPAGAQAVAAGAIAGTQVSFYSGMAGGMMSNWMNAAGTNYNR
ncbi:MULTISPECIES: hypothetical protein [unclassified Pseudomonas]|uniref:hypothetical protein n=1 Tax=unclassified Pseudomonas TaxID=196821 RepID=UPI00244CCC65|nr:MULTISPECIES: hypothetical protein [unclassified Pseudomonas]MDH0303786.1 hypothetical protein [Pseudomonas sp. GD04091]MDH1987407.1 hypothetical protein [Pseudomonas sp. GD03689]